MNIEIIYDITDEIRRFIIIMKRNCIEICYKPINIFDILGDNIVQNSDKWCHDHLRVSRNFDNEDCITESLE
jgi:hypothetical protein